MSPTLIDCFVDYMRPLIPDLKLVPKKNSLLMRFLGKILFFVPGFMENYTTTVGSTIYTNNNFQSNSPMYVVLLAHECQHILDHRRLSVLYPLIYLFPQVLALFSFLAFFAIWFSLWHLMWLCCLLFLLPIPAPGRVYIEKRGYLMSMTGTIWLYGREYAREELSFILRQFTGPAYYFMKTSNVEKLRQWFVTESNKLADRPSLGGKFYVRVCSFINEQCRDQI